MTIFNSIFFRFKSSFFVNVGRHFPKLSRKVPVGEWHLHGPVNHMLDGYMRNFRYYDYFLPLLCKIVMDSGLHGAIVDIGANIGDTAALIRQRGVDSRIVAIEASPHFFALLSRNIHELAEKFGDIRLVNAFIGGKDDKLALDYTDGTAGTRVVADGEISEAAPAISLDSLNIDNISLLKIDTDGYDGEIIEAHFDYLKAHRPLIWSEMFVEREESIQTWWRALSGISEFYQGFMLFDNVGRLVLHGILNEHSTNVIVELVRYTWIQRELAQCGAGGAGVPYFDIALFPETDNAVWNNFLKIVNNVLKNHVTFPLATK